MGLFDWLRRTRPPATPPGPERYAYPTGNAEFAARVEGGEPLAEVMAEVMARWTPGNEYLWDGYDPESLVDGPETGRYLVNALLFGRVTVYRALRAAGRDVRGSDPFEFGDLVPEVAARLRERFPGVFGAAARPGVDLEIHVLNVPPGDPGPGAAGPPGPGA